MKKYTMLMGLLLLSTSAFAVVSQDVTVRGRVGNVNHNTVTLVNHVGKVVVPRSAIHAKEIHSGDTLVAHLQYDELVKLNYADVAKRGSNIQ